MILKKVEKIYLKSLNLNNYNFNNLSLKDREELEDILANKLESSLTDDYDSTEESIICQNILDKLWD